MSDLCVLVPRYPAIIKLYRNIDNEVHVEKVGVFWNDEYGSVELLLPKGVDYIGCTIHFIDEEEDE